MNDLEMMKIKAQKGGVDDAWLYGYALINGSYPVVDGPDRICKKNISEGIHWLEFAAKRGCIGAMIELGSFYGMKVYKKMSRLQKLSCLHRALYWEKRAWRCGEPVAAQNIAMTYALLGREKLCHVWLKRGYVKCSWAVIVSLAKTYYCGYGVKQNIEVARRLYYEALNDPDVTGTDKELARYYLEMLENNEIPIDRRPNV